jgi:hypothetical protein
MTVGREPSELPSRARNVRRCRTPHIVRVAFLDRVQYMLFYRLGFLLGRLLGVVADHATTCSPTGVRQH